MCIDFRELNEVTKKVNSNLPDIDELLTRAATYLIFSSLDLASGYHQIPIAEESRHLLSFEFESKQYQYCVMPFGISNAPVLFQRTINQVMSELLNVLTYIDDIIVCSGTVEEHIQDLEEVLTRLRKFNLKARRTKCKFMMKEISAFGHMVSFNSITIDLPLISILSRSTKSTQPLGPRWARRLLYIMEFKFDIFYKSGATNYVPDVLSRLVYHIKGLVSFSGRSPKIRSTYPTTSGNW